MQIYPELSLKLLLYLQKKNCKKTSYIEYVDCYIEENNIDQLEYIEEENRLIIDRELKKKIIFEICEYILKIKKNDFLCQKKMEINKTIKKHTIFGNFCISSSLEKIIIWDLLTLLIILDSFNLLIWENRTIIFKQILDENLINDDLENFLLTEIHLIRLALCYTFKLGHIWNYLEHITVKYFEVCNLNCAQSKKQIGIEDILNFHFHFIYRQLKSYDHNYFIWSFINWLLFKLIPQILYGNKTSSHFYKKDLLILENWTMKLILISPLGYGGYHTLLNIIKYKLESVLPDETEIFNLFKMAYSNSILKMLNIILETFADNIENCILIILNFRLSIFLLLISFVKPELHIQILEKEIQWFLEKDILEAVSKTEDKIKDIEQHFLSIIAELNNCSSKNNLDFADFLKLKMPFLKLNDSNDLISQ